MNGIHWHNHLQQNPGKSKQIEEIAFTHAVRFDWRKTDTAMLLNH